MPVIARTVGSNAFDVLNVSRSKGRQSSRLESPGHPRTVCGGGCRNVGVGQLVDKHNFGRRARRRPRPFLEHGALIVRSSCAHGLQLVGEFLNALRPCVSTIPMTISSPRCSGESARSACRRSSPRRAHRPRKSLKIPRALGAGELPPPIFGLFWQVSFFSAKLYSYCATIQP